MRRGWVFISLNAAWESPSPALVAGGKETPKDFFLLAPVVLLRLLRQNCSSCSAGSGISAEEGIGSQPLAFARRKTMCSMESTLAPREARASLGQRRSFALAGS